MRLRYKILLTGYLNFHLIESKLKEQKKKKTKQKNKTENQQQKPKNPHTLVNC